MPAFHLLLTCYGPMKNTDNCTRPITEWNLKITRDNLRLTEAFCREKAVEKILGDFKREKIIAILPHCIFFSKTHS